MKFIITPKLIAIDTSVLGKVATDYFCNNQRRRKKASNFLSTISANGLIPFFCMHHLSEILQNKNDSAVLERFALIKKFSQVAWIKPTYPKGLIGSIIDIQGSEITKLINDPNIELETLISEIRQELILYSSGESFINGIQEELLILRKGNFFENQKSKAISSISHVKDLKIDNIKLSALHNSRLKFPSEVQESMDILGAKLKQVLKERGDKNLENRDEWTDQFVTDVFNSGMKMYAPNGNSLYKKFLNSFGIGENEVDQNWTIEDLGYYGIFREKLKVIVRRFSFDIEQALKIPLIMIPSWYIWTELDKRIRKEKIASGSNIIDKYLAGLAIYSDIIVVDKRVKEYFSQISRKNSKYSALNNCAIKLSNYENLGKQLTTIF